MDGPMVVATVAQGGGGIDVLEPGGSVAVLPCDAPEVGWP